MLRIAALVALGLLVAVACTTTDPESAPSPASTPESSAAPAPPPSTPTTPAATSPSVPTSATNTSTTSAPTATIASTTVASADLERRTIGSSVSGAPIDAVRRGTPGGRVVLVIGVIHGDEPAGAQVVDRLERLDVPAGVDLWLVRTMNPDGLVAADRHNANEVDLNRNFPADWGPIGQPGDSQYAGTGPASEPETQAMVAFIGQIRPDLVIWYHQDLYRIHPGSGRSGVIRARYAELTGLPLVEITGGTYTGVAATWARREIDPGVAFIVELGPTLTADEADLHARAVLTLAVEPN